MSQDHHCTYLTVHFGVCYLLIKILGLLVTLTSLMKKSLNFTSTRVQPADGFWGAVVVNEETNETEWNGMVRMLKDGEADFCNAGMVVSSERQEVAIKFVNTIQHA